MAAAHPDFLIAHAGHPPARGCARHRGGLRPRWSARAPGPRCAPWARRGWTTTTTTRPARCRRRCSGASARWRRRWASRWWCTCETRTRTARRSCARRACAEGVIHCFTGDTDAARRYLDLGFLHLAVGRGDVQEDRGAAGRGALRAAGPADGGDGQPVPGAGAATAARRTSPRTWWRRRRRWPSSRASLWRSWLPAPPPPPLPCSGSRWLEPEQAGGY